MLTMNICSLLMTCIMCIVCALNYCSISMHKVAGHLCGRCICWLLLSWVINYFKRLYIVICNISVGLEAPVEITVYLSDTVWLALWLVLLSHVSKFQNGTVGSWLGSSSMRCRVNICLFKIFSLASCELVLFTIHIKEKNYILFQWVDHGLILFSLQRLFVKWGLIISWTSWYVF